MVSKFIKIGIDYLFCDGLIIVAGVYILSRMVLQYKVNGYER